MPPSPKPAHPRLKLEGNGSQTSCPCAAIQCKGAGPKHRLTLARVLPGETRCAAGEGTHDLILKNRDELAAANQTEREAKRSKKAEKQKKNG